MVFLWFLYIFGKLRKQAHGAQKTDPGVPFWAPRQGLVPLWLPEVVGNPAPEPPHGRV